MSNTHKQVPQLLMRGFQHKIVVKNNNGINTTYAVYCLDLKTKQIKEEKIARLDAELDYYAKPIENHLIGIENKFAKTKEKIAESIKSGKNIEISKYEKDIKNFLKYCFLRSDQFLKKANEPSRISFLLGRELTHNEVIYWGDKDDFFDKEFKEKFITVMYNKSNIGFILPKCCFYDIVKKGENIIVLPISDKIAILLCDKKDLDSHIFEGKVTIKTINDDEIIKKLNVLALKAEKETDNSFVIAKSEKELIYFRDNFSITNKQ
ncbi:MAG: DUF4238 domain-containing protein [Clostridia bacterium]|nr:DUF4238 domain-containing protein [Clostridia bacterium]